jgi:hypothetical protein
MQPTPARSVIASVIGGPEKLEEERPNAHKEFAKTDAGKRRTTFTSGDIIDLLDGVELPPCHRDSQLQRLFAALAADSRLRSSSQTASTALPVSAGYLVSYNRSAKANWLACCKALVRGMA